MKRKDAEHYQPVKLVNISHKQSSNKIRIILNARGIKYEVLLNILDKVPASRLGKIKKVVQDKLNRNEGFIFRETTEKHDDLLRLCDDYDLDSREFYFNRDPHVLNLILNFYSTGKLHIDKNSCIMLLCDELDYWGIDESAIANCCEWKFSDKKDEILNELKNEKDIIKQFSHKEDFGNFYMADLREKIWNIVENQSSHYLTKIFFTFSVFMILLSGTVSIIRTLPEFKGSLNSSQLFGFELPSQNLTTTTLNTKISTNLSTFNKMIAPKHERHQNFNFILDYIQIVCTICSLMELMIRFFSSPSFCQFFKSPFNIIDLISTTAGFVYIFIDNLDKTLLNALRVFRIFLMIRLCRHSNSLQILIYVFRKSGVVVFSSLMFFVETIVDKNTKFISIPFTFWWAIQTMTTVGYGDLVPISFAGKIIGGLCALSGILLIPLPMGMLTNNFREYYHADKRNKKYIDKHKRQLGI